MFLVLHIRGATYFMNADEFDIDNNIEWPKCRAP
jgi:hypothetical protein